MTGALPAADRRRAVDLLFDRVEWILHDARDRFPLCADPTTGLWTYTRRGSWTAGFFCGLLWLRARRTGDTATAAGWTAKLTDRLGDDTITRAMTFWYGAAAGDILAGDASAAATAVAGAAALGGSASVRGPIPVGTAFGLGPAGTAALSIDAVAPLVRLLAWHSRRTGDPGPVRIARAQLDAHLLAPRPAGALVAAELQTDPARRSPRPHPEAFRHARGQAWGLLAFADAACVLGGYRGPALAMADRWLSRYGTAVPTDRFDGAERFDGGVDGGGGVDTSAAVIAAVALLKLAGRPGAPAGLRDAAAALVGAVVRGHLTGWPGALERSVPGRLVDTAYAVRAGERAPVESIWGTFFLLMALSMLDGDLDPSCL